MKLHDLLLKMYANEELMINDPKNGTTYIDTAEGLVNGYDSIHDREISTIQRSGLYNCIIIELE